MISKLIKDQMKSKIMLIFIISIKFIISKIMLSDKTEWQRRIIESTTLVVLIPFLPGVLFLYPLKTSENLGFLTFSGEGGGGGIEMEHYPKLGKRIITCSKPRIKSLEHCLILVHGQHCSKQSNHRTKHLFSSTDFFSKWNKYPVFYNLFTFSDKAFKVRLQVLPCQCQLPCSGAFIVNFK